MDLGFSSRLGHPLLSPSTRPGFSRDVKGTVWMGGRKAREDCGRVTTPVGTKENDGNDEYIRLTFTYNYIFGLR